MSSTSNAQDLLVNVFRPTYKWDSNTGFVPSLVVSNVTEVIASKIKANALVVSDNNVNTYIGSNAGVNASNTASNVGIGFSAMGGALNATCNVAIGTYALEGLSNSDSNVAIGAATDISGVGMRNVLIGTNVTLAGGSNNILIGVDLSREAVSNSLQIGTLLYGNLSNGYIGINTPAPSAPLDVSGIVVFRNKVGIQNTNPIYSLDIAGSVYATDQIIGGKGNVSNPMYTFIDSSGSGMYVPQLSEGFGTGAFAIAVNRGPAAIFSSNRVNFYQNLDVSGTFSARNIDISAFSVTDGTQSKPAMTFISDLSSGLYLVSSNRVGLATGGLRRMEILSNGDVSAGRIVARDISLGGTITTSTGCNVIGGVTLSNGNVILTGVATNTNLLVPGWFRNSDPATQIDISGGNISNSLTTRSSNFRASSGAVSAPAYSFVSDPSVGIHLAGTSTLGFDTSGVQRMCISGGFVGIGRAAPVVALDVLGDVSATTYNGPGGTQSAPHYTFSDDRTTGVFFPGANMIGMTAGGTERMRISNGNVGIGTTTPANALDVAGTIRVIGTTGGDLTFSNGNINLAGVPVISSTGVLSNASTTSNSIGGVTLNNGVVSNASSSVNTIGGVFLSSCNATTGTFTTNSSLGSNNIGGVTLSNTNITYAGAISNTTSTASNQIGGVTLSNGVVSNASTSSNSIGGVTLSNTNITYAGAISNTTTTTSNRIGGVTLSNTSINYAGAITGATDSAVNRIGGVTFCNSQVVNTSYTSSSNFVASNGTAGFPAYAFASEAGLGVFRSAAQTLALATSGSNRVSVDSYGAVTINRYTTPPAYAPTLTVAGDVSLEELYVRDTFITTNGSVTVPALAFANNQGLYVPGANQLTIATSGSNRMTFSNANVGIGTTNPQVALDVNGSAQVTGILVTDSNASRVNNVNLYANSTQAVIEAYKRDLTLWDDLVFRTANNTTNATRMTITGSNGFVGINQSNPQALLDLNTAGGTTIRATNGAGLFDVIFGGTSSEYASTSLNGYLSIYKANTTNKAASNLMVSLSPDTSAPCFILSNRFAIGQRTAGCALDVSAGSSEIAARFRVAGITGNNNVIELWAPTSSTTEPNRRIGLATNENTGTNTGNDFVINMYKDDGGYNSTPLILKRASGYLGISKYQPGYAIDVCGVISTNATFRVDAINYICRAGPAQTPGGNSYGVTWSTAVVTPAASCPITYTVNASSDTGDSFTVSSNGLYMVSIYAQAGTYYAIEKDVVSWTVIPRYNSAANMVAWLPVAQNVEAGGVMLARLVTGSTYKIKSFSAPTSNANFTLTIAPVYTTP